MRYVAKHNVSCKGRMITVGEIFEADFAEKDKERLLRLGAIEEWTDAQDDAAPSPIPAPEAENETEPEQAPETEEAPETDAQANEPETEADGGMEGMEAAEDKLTIDPLDAVVTKEAPKKKGRRKEG